MGTHDNATDDTTDFGFERVKKEEKADGCEKSLTRLHPSTT